MAKRSALVALLDAEFEPTQRYYNDIVDDVIRNPQLISRLLEGSVRDEALILLTTRHHRLARLFHRLLSVVRQTSKTSTANIIAAESVELLTDILPDLHQLLETTKLLESLVPALDVCLMSSQRPALCKLATVLVNTGLLLEHLVSDHLGVEVIRQWLSMQSPMALDAETLSLWTDRLVSMMHGCAIDHNTAIETQQWQMLQDLRKSLQKMETDTLRVSGKRYNPTTRHDLPALGSMTQLNKEDKKSRLVRHQDATNTIPPLRDDDKLYLKAFDIHVPGSKSSLLDAIKRLEGEKTIAILLSVMSRLPCYLCVSSLGSTPIAKAETRNESFRPASISQMKILDKGIGVWKVSLSPQALRSLLHLGSHGFVNSITQKLNDLASGCWDPKDQLLAGTKHQRKSLKVPVAQTECGQNTFILWQIATGMDVETEVPQQEITVWEVCDYRDVSKIIDRVIFLQQSYSGETIHRCRQHSVTVHGIQIPARFEDTSSHLIKVTRPSADLDVRTVDQDIIEMTNRFYALTEPVMHSIFSNDLSAVFPFRVSPEEQDVIRQFRTASLILGRSGTGKTTCLVFKLVGKYLASRAVPDERPVRQVLVTRSAFLADKLSSYTRRLIETLMLKSADLDSSQPSEHRLSTSVNEDLEQCTVLTLRDTSFPLICTWKSFLGILENTATKYDTPRLRDPEETAEERSDQETNTRRSVHGQVVDFDAFQSRYWPHFPQTLTKGLPVHLVFAEIMGVIKGSGSSRESLEPLSREDYSTRSCRLAPTFVLESERSRVYEVFKMYEKLKLELGGVDYVDRVVKLIRAIRRDSSLNQLLRYMFDEVYIDEIQDQRCLDIELLLSFVKDGRGFHFAGDTAQAISQESTFRFSDIKALFYEHFGTASAATHQTELSHPQMFTLSKNYRSHEGVLALASLIMAMMWKGFPETVDKLDPEIGQLNGPKPVLFCGVDSDVLVSKNVSSIEPSTRTSEFGADQVILVRDTHAKSSLKHQIGEVGLILTILESKGMEFDDVILWNFFTDCPDQAGVRSLEMLDKEPTMFDPRKYVGMCSELKSLYVAITRARIQLFIMESSKTTAATVQKLLGHDTPRSLVHVTSPSDEDFLMRLDLLRPATSLDPQQWSRRGAEFMQQKMYKDAIWCFKNAGDEVGETTAEGHKLERDAKSCESTAEFTRTLTLAVDRFKKVNLIHDAARALVDLGKSEDAAEILFQNESYSKAARLFAEADLSVRAVECYKLAEEYSEAAKIMTKERDYDGLVSYLDENRDKIATKTRQSYSILCKLLLKQNKTSIECRKHAINLLGSIVEQEKCFLDYGMHEELAGLYASQSRHIDLLHLYSRNGQLEQALSLAITKDLLHCTEDGVETEVLNLLDFVWAGHMQRSHQQNSPVPFKLPSGVLTPKVKLRAEQWEACNLTCSLEGSIARQNVAGISSNVPKTLYCLRSILNITTITGAKHLNDLPFEMMREAIEFTRDLILNKNGNALSTTLLLAGLWKPAHGNERLMVLPWSPLREVLVKISSTDYTKVVKQRVLDGLVPAILALDTNARGLWKEKWPKRCAQFIAIGFCPRQRKGEPCNWLHQAVSEQDCSHMAQDLLLVNGIFCDLAAIYYRRVMNETFQERYLGIRRYWLERLFRELTHLSAVEQHASTIAKTRAKLCFDKGYIGILSSVEEVLYVRLGKEWSKRSDFTSLLEQMQLAEAFGSKLQNGLFRALSHRLFLDQRGFTQRQLSLLTSLTENVDCSNASLFQDKLMRFLPNLDNIQVSALLTLHSLTTVCEFLSTHLILKTCATACIIPTSWIDLHIKSTSKAIKSSEPLSGDDRHRYHGCLIQLVKAFCHILSRLDKAALPVDSLLCGGRTHPSLLLRQRNAELVAVIVANLAATFPEPPFGFNEVWGRAKEAFDYDFVRAYHLRSRTPSELTLRLPASFAKYNGKDALVVVITDRTKGSPFHNLEHQPGVRTVTFDQLYPSLPTPEVVATSSEQAPHSASADDTDTADDQYSPEETEAMIKIQRLWRSVSTTIKNRRSYVSDPLCRAMARFFNIGAQCPDSVHGGARKAIRKSLLSQFVGLALRLDGAKGLLSGLQEDAMRCIENVEIDQGVDKSVDEILCRNRDVEALLEEAEDKMSEEHLTGLVREGVPAALEQMFKDVEDICTEIEEIMRETRKMLGAVSSSSS